MDTTAEDTTDEDTTEVDTTDMMMMIAGKRGSPENYIARSTVLFVESSSYNLSFVSQQLFLKSLLNALRRNFNRII